MRQRVRKVHAGTGKLIWKSYKQVGAIPGVLFLLSWLLWFAPTMSVPYGVVVPIFCLCLFLFVVLMNAIWIAKSESRFISPQVLKGKKAATADTDTGAAAMCLVDSSDFLRPGSIVTLYMREDEDETLIADGVVVHIQENGLLHVNLYPVSDTCGELFERIAGNDADVLRKLLVVPGGTLFWQAHVRQA